MTGFFGSERFARYRIEAVTMILLAAPVAITQLFAMSLGTITILFLGKLGTTELAAGALGFMICNVTGYSLVIGLLTAFDSLASQAWGSHNFHKVGIYIQRSVFICCLLVPIIATIWFFCEPILLFLKQEPEVAYYTAMFTRCMIPTLPVYFLTEILKRFLQIQSIVNPLIFIGFFVTVMSVALNYLFVFVFDLGFIGSPLALDICNVIYCVVLLSYIQWKGLFDKCWGGWSLETFHDLFTFCKLGFAGVAMVCMEWWCFEIQAVMAGIIGTIALDVHSILLSTTSFIFMIPLGFSVAASIRVGNLLGASDPEGAKDASIVGFILLAPVQFTIIAFILIFRHSIGGIFSDDAEVKAQVAHVAFVLALSMAGDCVQGYTSGVLRGQARQTLGAAINFVVYYLIGLPISILFAFPLKLEVMGLWSGLACASISQSIVYWFFISRSSWHELSEKAVAIAHKERSEKVLLLEGSSDEDTTQYQLDSEVGGGGGEGEGGGDYFISDTSQSDESFTY